MAYKKFLRPLVVRLRADQARHWYCAQHRHHERPHSGTKEDRRGSAPAFLRRALAGGPVSVADLERQARAAGLLGQAQAATHAKVFKRVKRDLDIRSIRTGFGRGGDWAWTMPAQTDMPEDPQADPPVTHSESRAKLCSDPPASDDGPADGVVEDRAAHIPDGWLAGSRILDPLWCSTP